MQSIAINLQLIVNVGFLVIIYSNFGDARKHHLEVQVSQRMVHVTFPTLRVSSFCKQSIIPTKHNCLSLQGDVRRYIALSTFGFFKGGTLDVNLYNFRVDEGREQEVVSVP